MGFQYNFPFSKGTPPGPQESHRVRNSSSVRHQRLLPGVGVMVVLVVIVGAFWFLPSISFPWSTSVDVPVEQSSVRIAFFSDRDGDEEIYVMNVDGSDVVRLTDNDSDDSFPAWSPDGDRIAFSSDRDGDDEIYVMNVDGSGVEQLTYDDSFDLHSFDWSPAWSPDGGRIAFASTDNGDAEIYVMNTDGTGLVRLTE